MGRSYIPLLFVYITVQKLNVMLTPEIVPENRSYGIDSLPVENSPLTTREVDDRISAVLMALHSGWLKLDDAEGHGRPITRNGRDPLEISS
jgi:hypothetical protein